jgi:riboflavin synthase
MFTGLITAIGTVTSVRRHDGSTRVEIALTKDSSGDYPWDCLSLDVGASVACDGCCLTVTSRDSRGFSVDISQESLAVTTLSDWEEGTLVNLEAACRVGDELGGHIVSGHVDGLAEIIAITKDGNGYRIRLSTADHLLALIAVKGSVTLAGVSLTVNDVDGTSFGVMIIPHTWTATTLGKSKVGDKINLEVDMLARYVARIMSHQASGQKP